MSFDSLPRWRAIQRQNFTRMPPLIAYLQLNQEQQALLQDCSPFPLNLPQRLAAKIAKGTLDDPILKQFLPLKEEEAPSSFSQNPIQEDLFCSTPKMLTKYQGRALLVTTSACAMHCRFCFRRHFPYETETAHFDLEIRKIKQDQSLKEVLLSGGDPLSLSDERLSSLLMEIAAIPHVQRIRLHSRFLIGIPERVTPQLLELFRQLKKQVIFVIHCNHPLELDDEVLASLKAIHHSGALVLNQSVLLKGVNDSAQVLQDLSLRLIDHGILPYYLHQLDQVKGAYHFEVPIDQGKELIATLARHLPGYGVPKYVQEIAQEPHKTPL